MKTQFFGLAPLKTEGGTADADGVTLRNIDHPSLNEQAVEDALVLDESAFETVTLELPWVQKRFYSPEDATKFLIDTLKYLDGLVMRNVELRHDVDFDTKKEVWSVYIRHFPLMRGPW